jgi:hypothetical protein
MNLETSTTPWRVIAGSALVALLVCVGVNALLYTVRACNPLVSADDWLFVDWIVRRAAEGHLTVGDLFVKRGFFDHAQPLRKLILLFHYRYFDLDFGIAALIGVMTAFANLGMLWLLVRHGGEGRTRPSMLAMAAFAALAAVYLSLNVPVLFNWSLLTLAFTSHAFILLFLVAAWWAYRDPRPLPLAVLFASALGMDIVTDAVGLITTVAALLALAVFLLKDRRLSAASRTSAAMIAGYVICALIRASISVEDIPSKDFFESPLGARLGGLIGNGWDVVSALRIPLIASVAHRTQLAWMLGGHGTAAEIAILVALLAAHGWFWWQAWRGRHNAAAFVAVGLMLMFYGTVLAILVVRIGLANPEYLWKPRYVISYAWNIVALLLMAIGQLPRIGETGDGPLQPVPGMRNAGKSVLLLAVVALLGIQIPLSVHSWQTVNYHSVWIQRRAMWLGELASGKQNAGPPCVAGSHGCGDFVNDSRFMRDHRLSVFSRSFRTRNRLYPSYRALPHGPWDARAKRAASKTSSK